MLIIYRKNTGGNGMSNNNKEKLMVLEEIAKRRDIELYREDFASFATNTINILPKSVSKGFVPFTFNNAQKLINDKIEEQRKETGKVRAIVLKARQQGISTYCTGRVYWKTYYTPYSKSVVMAHDSATSDALFNMSKNVIKTTDERMKPEEIRSNAKEIIINSPAMKKEENAGYRLYTAGSPEAGRGTTPTILHASEVAFWQHDAKILAGLFQGIPSEPGTEVILESTANGATGEFYRLWKTAERGEGEYVPIFIPWFLTPEYQRPIPPTFICTKEEKELKAKYDLTDEQINWRRIKISESGPLKFQQEYPATPDEAFVSSGANVFNVDKLNALIAEKPEAIRSFDGQSYFKDDEEGDLMIWDLPSYKDSFVIGADTSLGVGQDYCSAVVLNTENKVVGLYRNNRIDPSKFGELLFYLGRYFNNAFLAVESNSMGIATLQQLDSMDYVNLYKQTKIANVSNEEGERLGFRTTQATKPVIIGNLKRAIEDEDLHIPSQEMIQELKDYIALETGKTEAAPGCNDDTVIALAIAHEVLRTHRDKLSNTKVSWRQKVKSNYINTEEWI